MSKLIILEIQKIKGNFVLKLFVEWIILLALSLGFVALIYYSADFISQMPTPGLSEETLPEIMNFKDTEQIKILSGAIVSGIFIIYGSINYARFVVKDFAKNTLMQFYSYPVSRVKLMYAKIGLAALITITSMVIIRIIVNLVMLALIPELQYSGIEWLEIVTSALALALMAHIAMVVGIWRKSSIATVVTGFFLASFTQGNLGTITMYEYQFLPYIFALIGVGLAYFFVSKQKQYEFFN